MNLKPKTMRHIDFGYRTPYYKPQRPIDDLLKDQRDGKTLTLAERKRVQKYAEQRRQENQSQKKKKKRKKR